MGYQRAKWHSGLTYRQQCDQCKTMVEYEDDSLGFRPWYADGFVYCPVCKKPLRHNEDYAITKPQATVVEVEATSPSIAQAPEGVSKFCSQCGYKFRDEDKFCSQCGAKR